MQFEQRYGPAIADGSLTLTFRRWIRPQVVAGRRYRTAAGMLEVEAIDLASPGDITDAEAVQAGYPSAAALVAGLPDSAAPLYRVRFHGVAEPDPREELAAADDLSADDVAQLDARLERLDRASSSGPWTMAVLQVIAERPAVRAPDLAASFGREALAFK